MGQRNSFCFDRILWDHFMRLPEYNTNSWEIAKKAFIVVTPTIYRSSGAKNQCDTFPPTGRIVATFNDNLIQHGVCLAQFKSAERLL